MSGVISGVLIIGVLSNGMTIMGVSDYWQYVVRGSLILFAVFLNTMVRDRLKEKGL